MEHLARNCSQKKEDDPSHFSGDKDVVTGSEAFFSSIVYNDKAVFAYNPNVSSRGRGESIPFLGLDSRVFVHTNLDRSKDPVLWLITESSLCMLTISYLDPL